jgi:hypothetical protein
MKNCPISGKPMRFAFSAKVLNKYEISYFFSDTSGLLQTEQPYWLSEAYDSAIGDSDTGLVQRNLLNARRLEPLFHRTVTDGAKIVDVGGGYGLLTRLLRDRGFDCYWFDKYCPNLFATGFEAPDGLKADALIAFEVLEHVEDPKAFVSEIFDRHSCRTLIFSTLTFEGKPPTTDWWYYARESGQHITFYQPRTLAMLARYLGCTYSRIGHDLHIISPMHFGLLDLTLLCGPRVSEIYTAYVQLRRRNRSHTWQDHLEMGKRIK